MKHAKPAEVLTSLLEDLGVNYVFPSEALNGVPMDFVVTDMPLEQALKLFLAHIKSPLPFRYVTTTGIFVFFNDATGQPLPIIPKDVDPAEYNREGQITINFKNVERLEAIRALLQVFQKNYTINVPLNDKVSLEREIPFRAALPQILRSGGADVTYKVENGVYTILKAQTREYEE